MALEELCRTAMYDICHKVVKQERLSKPKGTVKGHRWLGFFGSTLDRFHSFNWDMLPLTRAMNARSATTIRRSWWWFNDHSEQICMGYIRKVYGGDVEKAMSEAGCFQFLFDDFKEYFANRRKIQVEKIETAVAERKQELAQINKLPQSHGGVANLLKILTKTMHEQGSSVHTVAKVQYAICVQAGIYIPDEFLTDVLTAVDVMEGE